MNERVLYVSQSGQGGSPKTNDTPFGSGVEAGVLWSGVAVGATCLIFVGTLAVRHKRNRCRARNRAVSAFSMENPMGMDIELKSAKPYPKGVMS